MATAQSIDLALSAAQAASAAAERSGIKVRRLDDLAGIQGIVQLFQSIWQPEDRELIGVATLRALAHSGNYVFGAHAGDELVAAIIGFLGWKGENLQLHSHILGVSPTAQGTSVGFALKQHQRAWCLERGISKVNWTYDPLISRNAYFNLTKLGATATNYYLSFYGALNDKINGHDESDRILLEWDLESPRAASASVGETEAPDEKTLVSEGAEIALQAGSDLMPVENATSAETILVGIPLDIVEVRGTDPDAARRWRFAARQVLHTALTHGYVARAMSRSGYYVLEKVG